MNKRSIILLCLFFSFLVQPKHAQNTKGLVLPKPTEESNKKIDPPPGSIQLINGYVHKTGHGIDTLAGEIAKPNAMRITYDIGFLASNYAWRIYNDLGENVAWYKLQKVNDMTLYLIRGKDGTIVATFGEPCANFIAKTKTEEEATDFILMIMTYKPVINKRMPLKMVSDLPTC